MKWVEDRTTFRTLWIWVHNFGCWTLSTWYGLIPELTSGVCWFQDTISDAEPDKDVVA